ncbi:hypothetical protein F5877DRAFT_65257 [Lentinula edodes]|nr:hypothetical protein F5877DRAFT_65257 [Lentinula edodes]
MPSFQRLTLFLAMSSPISIPGGLSVPLVPRRDKIIESPLMLASSSPLLLSTIPSHRVHERAPRPMPPVLPLMERLVQDGTMKRVEDPSVLEEDDKKVFNKKLESDIVTIGQKIEGGSNNFGIWTVIDYKGHPRDDLIMKILPERGPRSYGEAKALRMMHLLVDSGETRVPAFSTKGDKDLNSDLEGMSSQSDFYPVVIMKKKKGVLLKETQIYKTATPKEQLALDEQVVDWSCKIAAKDAVTSKVYHNDNNLNNALVTIIDGTIAELELVDYGPPDTYIVIREIEEENLYKMCKSMMNKHLKRVPGSLGRP